MVDLVKKEFCGIEISELRKVIKYLDDSDLLAVYYPQTTFSIFDKKSNFKGSIYLDETWVKSIPETKDLLDLEKYRKAGIKVKLVKVCPYCGGEISAIIGGSKKKLKRGVIPKGG